MALHSPSPRCRQQPLPPLRPNHPSDTHAAASQHGRSRCWNPGGRLGTNRDRVRHKGNGTGGRRGRLARTQIVEAETAATVVSQEAREEGLGEASPDTLCATGSLTSQSPLPSRLSSGRDCHPSPTRAGGNRGTSRPSASSCSGPGTRPTILRRYGDRSRASARLAVSESLERALGLGLLRQTVLRAGGSSQQLRSRNPLSPSDVLGQRSAGFR